MVIGTVEVTLLKFYQFCDGKYNIQGAVNFSMPKTMSIEYNVQKNHLTNLRDRRQMLEDRRGLAEKLKQKAKWHQHLKTLQEKRGIMVQQEASVAQREAEVSLVNLFLVV